MKTKFTLLMGLLCFALFAHAQTNVALRNFTATASTGGTGPNGENLANLAIDGNPGTRWASDAADNQWLVIDMGAQRTVTGLKIIWETAKAKHFTIDISDNNSTWTTIVTDENTVEGQNTESNYSGWNATGRYLRVNCIDRLTGWGNSIWELEIYGNFPSVTASSALENSPAKYAIDGNRTGTRWESTWPENDEPRWLKVDLGKKYDLSRVEIYWEGAKAEEYLIEVSDNDADWTTAATITGNISANDNHQTHTISASGRYVRIYCTKRALGAYGYSIWELEVYDTGGVLPVSLKDFTTKSQTNGTVSLNWSTATEQGNSHFLLEKSADGKNFGSLTSISSKGANSNYQYTDNRPYNGNNYYRLTQVDADGKSKELGVRTVNVSLAAQAAIYPNPLRGNTFYITLGQNNNSPVTVSISNIVGKEVYKGNFNTSNIKVELASKLPAGMYIVRAGAQQAFKLYVE